MKLKLTYILFFLCLGFGHLYAQTVGIGTTDPRGALDVTTSQDLGLVYPRVTSLAAVTDGQGGAPIDGTTVYDLSQDCYCFYTQGDWFCFGFDSSGTPFFGAKVIPPLINVFHIKADNPERSDSMGASIDMSTDGNYLVIGAPEEDGTSGGVNPADTGNDSSFNSGAAYVYVRNNTLGVWEFQARLKAASPQGSTNGNFGFEVEIDSDGDTIAVSSNISEIVTVYTRSATTWSVEETISRNGGRQFGSSISLTDDGNRLAIGDQQLNSITNFNRSGIMYIYDRTGSNWNETASILPENVFVTVSGNNYSFGNGVTISGDGTTVAISARGDDIGTPGIQSPPFGAQTGGAATSGAVHVFRNTTGNTWVQEAYVKPSIGLDDFGFTSISTTPDSSTLDLDLDGDVMVVGDNSFDNPSTNSGLAFVFQRTGSDWAEVQRLEANGADTPLGDDFGSSVSVNSDGTVIAIGAPDEDGVERSLNDSNLLANESPVTHNTVGFSDSGAVYIFSGPVGNATLRRQLKSAYNPTGGNNQDFGTSVALSADGTTVVAGSNTSDNTQTLVINASDVINIDLGAGTSATTDSGGATVFNNLEF